MSKALQFVKPYSLLGVSGEAKMRKFYKEQNGLSRNTREQRLLDDLGIQSRRVAYRVIV